MRAGPDVLHGHERAKILHWRSRNVLWRYRLRARPELLHGYERTKILRWCRRNVLWQQFLRGGPNLLREQRMLSAQSGLSKRTLRSIEVLIQP
jgi:hypothetical protein